VANTRSAIKRVRQNARRARINAPRRTVAKTYVAKAVRIATGATPGDAAAALTEAIAALDRAAKAGAIHPNAAARRKSRLALKVNAALGGAAVEIVTRTRATGKAAAAKAARARVAASKARGEAGPKTAAGKARVALARTATGSKAGPSDKATTAVAPKSAVKATAPAKGASAKGRSAKGDAASHTSARKATKTSSRPKT